MIKPSQPEIDKLMEMPVALIDFLKEEFNSSILNIFTFGGLTNNTAIKEHLFCDIYILLEDFNFEELDDYKDRILTALSVINYLH